MDCKVLLNTTFVVHQSVYDKFLNWLETSYVPQVARAGIFGSCEVARVGMQLEPDTCSVAVLLRAAEKIKAEQWFESHGAELHRQMGVMFGENLMHFSTFMDVLMRTDF